MPFGPCWKCGADSFSGLERCPHCGAARPFGPAPAAADAARGSEAAASTLLTPARSSTLVRTCPRCGAILRPGEELCPDCAREPEVEPVGTLVPCPACGQLVSPRASSCPRCGDPIAQVPAVAPAAPLPVKRRHRRGIAAALALFLGGLGAHKFYLQRPGLGVLYLLFAWTLIPSIVGVVEAAIYAFSSDEDFERRYG